MEKLFKEFKYSGKDRKVFVLRENDNTRANSIQGIDLNSLSEEERKNFEKFVEDYFNKLKPFMKAYRNFLTSKIEK